MIEILKISAIETFPVRHAVLRKGHPIEDCHFQGDELSSTQHFGLYENRKLVGVASLFSCPSSFFDEERQIQLRGMALLEECQNKGYGQLLIRQAEIAASGENADLLWFNARENAVGFYKKMGYQIIGTPFPINDIGLHFVMYKKLNH